jgi:cytochrome c oxidase subunit 2
MKMNWWLPENIASFGREVDFLFYVILAITGIAFVLVQAALVYLLVRYRHREGRRALYIHGSRRLELVWTIIPALILFSLALYQRSTWLKAKQGFPDETQAVVIRVFPEQFEWYVQYPGPDGVFDTEDDIVPPVNVLHVPVNKPVLLLLESRDVIHSFFVPELRIKQDAVPGMTTRAWFQATKTGRYEIACAELCGLGHYRMRGFLTVETPEEFQAWLAEMKAAQ